MRATGAKPAGTEDEAGAAKITKARSLGTTVLDEAGLLALLSGTNPAPQQPAAQQSAPKPLSKPSATAPFHQQELF